MLHGLMVLCKLKALLMSQSLDAQYQECLASGDETEKSAFGRNLVGSGRPCRHLDVVLIADSAPSQTVVRG